MNSKIGFRQCLPETMKVKGLKHIKSKARILFLQQETLLPLIKPMAICIRPTVCFLLMAMMTGIIYALPVEPPAHDNDLMSMFLYEQSKLATPSSSDESTGVTSGGFGYADIN